MEVLCGNPPRPVKEHRHNGLIFVEARKGSTYSIKLRNNFNRRAMAILSVDGIEVLKGKKAEQAEGGYVLDPYSSIEIKGYRISDTEVATFVFGADNNSYSTYIGQSTGELAPGESSKNNGVIGVRVVLEKYKEPNWDVHLSSYDWPPLTNWGGNIPISGCAVNFITGCYTANASAKGFSRASNRTLYNNAGGIQGTDSNNILRGTTYSNNVNVPIASTTSSIDPEVYVSNTPNFDVGTEWGEKKQDKIKRVDFDMSEEVFEMALYYASREALEAIGIDFSATKPIASGLPQAFGTKYCPAPKGYK